MACADRLRGAALVLAALVGGGLQAQTAAPTVTPGLARPVAPLPAPPVPAGRWTAAQLQQAFAAADTDSDGTLSRAESQQLFVMPRPFEELDRNKDGVLSREEYEGAAAQ